jgi:hypothetical protein
MTTKADLNKRACFECGGDECLYLVPRCHQQGLNVIWDKTEQRLIVTCRVCDAIVESFELDSGVVPFELDAGKIQ